MYIANCFEGVFAYAKNVQSPYLFPSRKGEYPITPTQAYRQLNKAADFAGVEHVGNHTLRKTFGYWFYKATKDIAMLQRILHHSHPSVDLENKEVIGTVSFKDKKIMTVIVNPQSNYVKVEGSVENTRNGQSDSDYMNGLKGTLVQRPSSPAIKTLST